MKSPDQDSSIEAVVVTEAEPRDVGQDVVSAMISLCLHLVCLLLFAFWVFPSLAGVTKVEIEMGFSGAETVELDTIELVESPDVLDVSDSEAPQEDVEIFQPTELEYSLESVEQVQEPESTPQAKVSIEPASFSIESLGSSSTVESAVDRITSEIRSKLEKGDLLVVWLLDSSHSLVDDRKRVAARLTPFYEDLVQEKSSKQHILRSAVVSYGSKMRERVPPTTFGTKVVAAVEKLPIDKTGAENVFDAVSKCVLHYRRNWDKQCTIVIWTDESGDDVNKLPSTIDLCRKRQVSVSVVGPSSVLGADTGLHSYMDPKSNEVYQLPVQRGPDSAMPERMELGYWYVTRFGRGFGRFGGIGGRGQGQLPSWLGGQDLAGILSGFSPYALTRLAAQTGGSYTIFDRPEDRAPFDPVLMKEYAPSYASIDQYEDDIQSHRIRQAVLRAVGELKGKKIDSPPMMFFTKKTGERFFDFMRYYYTPQEFQNKLRGSRGRLKGQATRYSKYIEKALRHLSTDETLATGLEDDLRYEKSPRWRAWYDLTRGRLLATSARLEEYRLVIDEITKPGVLQGSTNHVVLVPDQQIRGSSRYKRQAEEAEQLLRRCVSEHQDTPWETLAQRELDFAIGIAAQERALTPTGVSPTTRRPNLPRF